MSSGSSTCEIDLSVSVNQSSAGLLDAECMQQICVSFASKLDATEF